MIRAAAAAFLLALLPARASAQPSGTTYSAGIPQRVIILNTPLPVSLSGGSFSFTVAGGSVTAYQGGSYTVTPGTGTWQTIVANTVATIAKQDGVYTVTPGTGTWAVTGNVGATQIGSWTVTPGTGTWNVAGSVNVSNFPAVQTVSPQGSWTVTPGTGTFPVSAASLPLPAGAATSALQTTGNSTLSSILSALASVPVTGPLTDAQLRASPVPVSGSLSASGSTITIVAMNGNTTPIPVSGNISATQNGSYTVTPGTGSWAVTGANSGSYTVTPGTGTWNTLANIAGSVTVTPGTGTWSASQSGTWTVQPGNTANTTPWLVTANGSTIAVTGLASAALATESTLASLNAKVTTVNTGAIAFASPQPVTQSGAWTSSVSGSTVVVYNGAGTSLNVAVTNTPSFSQSGSFTVTPGTGVFSTAMQGSLTVTPGTGTFPVSGTVNIGAQTGGALATTSTSTVITGSLPAGTNNIGDVDVLSLPALPAGSNNIGAVNLAAQIGGALNVVSTNTAVVNPAGQSLMVITTATLTTSATANIASFVFVATVSATTNGIQVGFFNRDATKIIKIQRLWATGTSQATITGVQTILQLKRVTALTKGGTVFISSSAYDSADQGNLDVDIEISTGAVSPTYLGGTTTRVDGNCVINMDETAAANSDYDGCVLYDYTGPPSKPLTLRQNQGFIIVQGPLASAAGTYAISGYFTQE